MLTRPDDTPDLAPLLANVGRGAAIAETAAQAMQVLFSAPPKQLREQLAPLLRQISQSARQIGQEPGL